MPDHEWLRAGGSTAATARDAYWRQERGFTDHRSRCWERPSCQQLSCHAAHAAAHTPFPFLVLLALQLDILRPRVLPLLTSPFVGAGAAFDCCLELAACLPGNELAEAALSIACSLRLVMLTEREAAAADWQHLSQRECVAEAVAALQAATGGQPGENGATPPPALRRPLPGAAYMFCFPILRAVMRWAGRAGYLRGRACYAACPALPPWPLWLAVLLPP